MSHIGQERLDQPTSRPAERNHDRYVIGQKVAQDFVERCLDRIQSGEPIDDRHDKAEELERKAGGPIEKSINQSDAVSGAQMITGEGSNR